MPMKICFCLVSWIVMPSMALAVELFPAESPVQVGLSGRMDLETYASDGAPPGLLFSDDGLFFNPRLSLFADVHFGSHWYAHVQARVDRGFDPGSVAGGQGRLDEYLLRWTPLDEPVVNLQFGKFATAFGNWVPRHLAWDNPFVTAPLPYENMVIVGDQGAPPGAAGFVGRRNRTDLKRSWMPVVWGPSYATGASIFGRVERFDYVFEIKNASLSSRPASWDLDEVNFGAPTFTGRLGFRPDAAWNLGVSGSTGSFIVGDPLGQLPVGDGREDYRQSTLGLDVSYAHGHLQLWSEVIASRFHVPNVGHADTVSYFVEAKYKVTESLFAALRWNQQFFDSISTGAGGRSAWDSQMSRVDLGLGYRLNRHLQFKLQYSFGRENKPGANAENLLATQVTWRF